jgi:protein-disulfide isomerase
LGDLYRITSTFIVPGFLVFALGACQGPDKKKLADVNDTVITAQEVERATGRPLFQLYQQIYTLQRQKLDELIDERLLSEEARKRGVSVDVLLEQEVNAKILPVTNEDILALYKTNKERIPVELDKVQDQIRDLLKNQRLTSQKALLIKSLREKAKIVTYLKQPVVYRVKLDVANAPSRGPSGAPVSIVKFEDFQCPYCKTVQPTYEELLKRYDGKVRLVHKDLPLDAIHPQARQAAEAARCAEEQGKFWEYHDKLYANSPKASVEELKSYAKEVGLNAAAFDQCYGSEKFKAAVQKDLNDGAQLGVTGTPTFFINGREISGAQPVEAFAAIIDEELGQAK